MNRVRVTIFALVVLGMQFVRASTDWPYLKLTQVGSASGFFTYITDAGDGSGRLFATERAGRIWIIQNNEFANSPFLDISNKVTTSGEGGLLSLAFPNGSGPKTHFYVCYTRSSDGASVVSRFQIGTDTNHVDPATEEVLLTVPTVTGGHYGGQLAFGPDGYLYISEGDREQNAASAQDSSSFFGKLLRIDVESAPNGYAVPAGNPFVSNTNFLPEIWALGLRNPWRFSFDRLTGDLYIGDVGASSREEVDRQPAGVGGQNYGWPVKEGSLNLQSVSGVDPASLTPPIFEYDHNGGVASIIGGFVSRGPSVRMNGIYFYGDYSIGGLYGLKPSGTNWEQQLLQPGYNAISFGEDQSGQLYLVSAAGQIYRIDDTGEPYPAVFDPPPQFGTNIGIVAISTITPNAQIHWTTNGLDPTEADPAVSSGGTLPIAYGTTIKARVFRNDLLPSEITSATYTNFSVARPEFNLSSGPITNGFPLAISIKTPGALIHYTTDGSDPDTNSPLYNGPQLFTGFRLTLKAKAFRDGFTPSETARSDYGLISYEDAEVTTLAGNGAPGFADGVGTNAQFHFISAIHLDPGGNLIVGEYEGAVRKITPAGQVSTLLDYNTLTNSGPPIINQIGVGLGDLCIASNGVIYFTAIYDNRIWKLDPTNGLAPFAGTSGPTFQPQDGPPGTGTFLNPTVMALDNRSNIFVADDYGAEIRKVAPDGTISTLVYSSFLNNYNWTGLALDSAGNLFGVSSQSGDSEIFRITSNGQVQHFAGNNALEWDGPADQASLNLGDYALAATIDSSNNLYTLVLRGQLESRAWIRKVHTDGSMTTLAGSWDPRDSAAYRDGASDQAAFNGPESLCVDTNGNVYVADWGNFVIRKITPAPKLQITATLSPTDKTLLLSWPSVIGHSYQVQSSPDLRSWSTVVDWIDGIDGNMTLTNPLGPSQATNQFFRVQARHD